ncbi:MAG: hypothetical protein B6U72_03795 [Candidatus Altiarchaeales archaeon ex4484_2]|nr:MAG: hypothetical protein B6U72_03795 [Candidatus Altiarchaeales archaeon ex4484_2]
MIDISALGIVITDKGMVIAAVSAGIAVLSSLVRMAVLDREQMKEMKEKLKKQQTEVKEAAKSGHTKKAQKAQEEMMKLTMENMKHSMKPLMFTFIPFILIFNWLRGEYGDVGTVATLFGFNLSWFWWYLVTAMLISITLNKIFKLS